MEGDRITSFGGQLQGARRGKDVDYQTELSWSVIGSEIVEEGYRGSGPACRLLCTGRKQGGFLYIVRGGKGFGALRRVE